MGFYKSVGLKHFEDLEDYIKTKGWLDHSEGFDPFDTSNSYWSSCADAAEMYLIDPNVVWSIKKEGSRWFIREIATIRGGRSYNGIDITEEIVDMYNAMLAKQPVYIDIEKGLDYDVRAIHGKICTGTLKLKTTVKIVELSKEDMSSLPWTWNAREKKRILLEHEFASKINFKRKAYSKESEEEIRDKRQQWKYASRYGRK